jgi:endo-1,4-beta-D-glucanase Y
MDPITKPEVETAERSTDDTAARTAASDAWAIAMADLLWNDPRIQEKMSAEFQRIVDRMVEVRFGGRPLM